MPVRDLGTVRETVPRGAAPPPLDNRISARLLGCLSLVEERESSAEWHRDLLAVELACVLACILLATVSVLQHGDVLEALDGHDGVVQLQITGEPHISPCEANRGYTAILSSHTPVRFRAAASGAGFVQCGWKGRMPSLRIVAGIVLPLILLWYMLQCACMAAINTGSLGNVVGIGHGTVRHDHRNTVFMAILAVLTSMMMLSVTFIDLRAVLSARTWCRNGLRGAQMVVKGIKFAKDAGAGTGIVCSNGKFFWLIGFDIFATVCWILSARMHIDYYMRDIYDAPPTQGHDGKSPQRVAATVGVTTGMGETARYPEARGGGGGGNGLGADAGSREVLAKEQDPRSWKKMPI